MIHNVSLAHSSNINLALARDRLNRDWRSFSIVPNLEVKPLTSYRSSININPLLSLPLAETVSTLTQIVDFETNILEKNYRSKYLSSNRKDKRIKVLVIKDRDSRPNYICSMLRTENFQVIEAKDRKTAIQLAQTEKPDLIICELMLPIVDRYSVVDSLRNSTTTANILLLFVTVHHQQTKIGSEIFLVSDRAEIEPLTKEKLLEEIDRHVNLMAVLN